MKVKLCLALLILVGINAGCPIAPPASGGASDLEDTDGDGFLNLPEPVGVDTGESISVEVINELTRDELMALIPATGLEGLLTLVTIKVDFDVTLSYPNGETVPFSDSRELEPFELRFEAVCPDTVSAVASVVASAPLVGTVFSEELPPIVLDANDFECGSLISIRALLDARGQPDVDFSIEPL